MNLVRLCALLAIVASAGQAQAQYSPKQQAAINVAAAYARDTLKMSTFQVVSVRQDGTLVNAVCTRTVTFRGQTTTTRYAVSFNIAVQPPPRGQTVGQMYVSG